MTFLLNFYSIEIHSDLLLIFASVSLLGLSSLPIFLSAGKLAGDILKAGLGGVAGALATRGLDAAINHIGGGAPNPAPAPTPAPTPAAPTAPTAGTPAAPSSTS